MKQILYTLMALLAVITTSCSNDDIAIETTGKFQTVSYQVNVQNVYDEFDITERGIRDYLRNKIFQIGIKTFIYDTAGNKVDESFVFTNKLDPIVNNVELTDGSYTMVVVETYVDPDTQEPVYHFEDVETLSTLNLSIKYYDTHWYQVVGVGYQTINIAGNHVSTTITPHAVGSIIDVSFINYVDSPYTEFAFGTEDCVNSYKLDPKLSRAERFTTVDTEDGYTNIRGVTYSSNEYDEGFGVYILEPSIKAEFFVRKATTEQNKWITERDIKNRLELQDGGYYYAGSYYVGADYYSDWYFGDNYSEFLNWVKQEEGLDTLVPDLYLDWGGSVLSAQSMMTQYQMTVGSYGEAILQEDGSYAIAYGGNGKVSQIIYIFTSSNTGLFECDVQYDKSEVTSEEILNYLNANYILDKRSSGNIYMYWTSDYSTIVMFFEIGGVYDIGFVDAKYMGITPDTRSDDSQVYQKVVDMIMQRTSNMAPKSNNHIYKISEKPNCKSVSMKQSNL